jgi:hypothetical protein
MNKKILIVSLIVFLGLSVAIYQYAKELQSEFTSAAYSTAKPANGHSWSEMECTSDLCVTGGKVGMGTDSPTEKLQVTGNIKASGTINATGVITGTDVCNSTGNCLSALATLTNACGAAATNYVYSASAFSGSYCSIGTSTPSTPSFPAAGSSTTWTCPVANDPTHPISCTATRAGAPVAGVCGPAAASYPYSATTYAGAYCTTGTTSASPAFPAQGGSSSWSCAGVNGGNSPSCVASRSNPMPLVNSVHNEAQCVAAGGEVIASDVGYNQCRFNAATCPSLWTRYNNYGTTATGYCDCSCQCGAESYCGYGCKPDNAAIWGNPVNPLYLTCGGYGYCGGGCGCSCSCGNTSYITQIGCF